MRVAGAVVVAWRVDAFLGVARWSMCTEIPNANRNAMNIEGTRRLVFIW